MHASVLGRLRLRRGGAEVPAPSGRVGALLELLLLRPGHLHSSDDLVAALWDDQPGPSVGGKRLRVLVSRLRQLLDDADDETDPPDDGLRLERDGTGYRLVATVGALDSLRFEEAADRAIASGSAADATAALALWDGIPFDGFAASEPVRLERARLTALHHAVVAGRLTAEGGFTRTKSHPPTLGGLVLERTRLLDALPAGGSGRAVVVVAPAGYGKSTVLASWAARHEGTAWAALDRDDRDPSRLGALLHRSAGAVGAIAPGSGFQPGAEGLEALARAGALRALVVDDVHAIEAPEAVAELSRIVAALLDAGATVALSSRAPLPAAIRRAIGRPAATLGPDDLRFTPDDVGSLFPDEDRRRQAWAHGAVEGWPIGVVSLLRSGAADRGAPEGDDLRSLASYVGDEVVAAMEPDLVAFLLEIAPLDEFCVSLCNAVTERDDAADLLGRLRDHGLFLVETEGEGDLGTGWYRLHHGVTTELRRRAASSVDVHRALGRAARWHHERGLKASALRCAIAGHEPSVVAALAGDVVLDSVFRREFLAASSVLRTIAPDDTASDYRSHSICCTVALIWLPQAERARWVQSRLRHFGGEDILVLMDAVRSAIREGRSAEAVTIADHLAEVVDAGLDPAVADLAPVFIALSRSDRVRARIAHGELHHDDPELPATVAGIRPFLPLAAAWLVADWALVALLEGNDALARSLAGEFHEIRVTTDAGGVARERGLVGALLAGMDTDDPYRLRSIVTNLQTDLDRASRFGHWANLAMLRLTAAHLCERAGDDAAAAQFAGLADATLRTLPDVPQVHALQQRLDLTRDPSTTLTAAIVMTMTPRQRAILSPLLSGASLTEIADQLHISVHTLRGHLRTVYARLGVSSRAAAMARLAPVDLGVAEPT